MTGAEQAEQLAKKLRFAAIARHEERLRVFNLIEFAALNEPEAVQAALWALAGQIMAPE